MQAKQRRHQESCSLQGSSQPHTLYNKYACSLPPASTSQQKERAVFSYGAGGRASKQLKALAVSSEAAMQTIAHSCSKSSQPIRMVGWNGQELPIREYSWSINYELEADLHCKVGEGEGERERERERERESFFL